MKVDQLQLEPTQKVIRFKCARGSQDWIRMSYDLRMDQNIVHRPVFWRTQIRDCKKQDSKEGCCWFFLSILRTLYLSIKNIWWLQQQAMSAEETLSESKSLLSSFIGLRVHHYPASHRNWFQVISHGRETCSYFASFATNQFYVIALRIAATICSVQWCALPLRGRVTSRKRETRIPKAVSTTRRALNYGILVATSKTHRDASRLTS